ncbi:helix-turn-helix domain-containing protein [Ephemeroptericola cinctiostellae]|nr:helix-turn-helix transcriptional regulator [Ephemeroptericola cinctiostellae]
MSEQAEIGKRIKDARQALNVKQKWLSANLGITATAVSKWESGEQFPTLDKLSKIALLLNINFEWLATGRGEMVAPAQSVAPPTDELSAMIRAMNSLSAEQRNVVLKFIHDWTQTLK